MKKINRSSKTRQLFLRCFALYMGVFLFVLLLIQPIYHSAYEMARDTMRNSYGHHLSQSVTMVEQVLDRCQRFSFQTAAQSPITQLSMAQPQSIRNYVTQMNHARDIIHKTHTLLSDEVSTIFLLYEKNRFLVNDTFITDQLDNEYGSLFEVEGMNAQQWYENVMHYAAQPTLLPACSLHSSYLQGHRDNVLPLIVPLNTNSGYRVGRMVFYLKSQWIKALIVDEGMASSNILFSVENQQGEVLLGDDLQSDPASDYLTLSGAPFLLLQSQELALTGIRLKLAIPDALFTKEANDLVLLIKLYIYLGLLGAFLISTGYALHHFRSIRHVLQMDKNESADSRMVISPYRYIQDLVRSLAKARDDLSQRMLLLENTYASNLLENICIRGLMSQKELETGQKILAEHGRVFCVAVMRIHPESSSEALLSGEEKVLAATPGIVLHIRPDRAVYILTLDHGPIAQLAAGMEKNLGALGLIGLSLPLSDAQALHAGYQQAYQAALQGTEEHPVHQAADERLTIPTAILNQQKLVSLQNWIVSGKTDQVSLFFDELSKKADSIIGINQLQFFFVLRQFLFRLSYEEGAVPANLQILLSPRTDETFEEGLGRLQKCAMLLTQASQSQHSTHSQQQLNAILSIIEAEFSNPLLSADYIAEKLNYSPKHIYSIVKDNTGKTVGDIIEDTRLEFAAEMLQHSDKKNDDIALLCGFTTTTTFYRVFKRKHGISPGEWRKALGENTEE